MTEPEASPAETRPALTEPGHAHLAVLGSPISHSRSPRIHAAAYAALGLPWSYQAIECEEPGLAALLEDRGEHWRGFSVTMPLKVEAHRLSRVLDPIAEESGVVNTLMRLDGGAGWAGFNTDVPGLAAAIAEAGLDASRTIVLGSGATAVSAVLAARSLGARQIEIVARNVDALSALVARFGGAAVNGAAPLHVSATNLATPEAIALGAPWDEASLVISTLPGPAARHVELPERLTRVPLFDVAYDPWPSPLAARWVAAGGEAHAGMGMLLHQALAQVRIFVNGEPSVPLDREDAVLQAMREAAQVRE